MVIFLPGDRRDPVPSVSLEMYENLGGMRETEDINSHHLLQQHLYKSRKQVSIFVHMVMPYLNNMNTQRRPSRSKVGITYD